MLAELTRYAAADANVLVTGGTGAGKDLVARTLHALSSRRHHPFVVVDCPGLPATLIESELFGHERGAFTDATMARPGRFELAGQGVVYLDRVDELPLDAQGKLLRLVEQKQVERLGSNISVPVRARVVASASEDIALAVAEGRFRTDLYHRLRVLPLRVPPLAERKGDLSILIRRLMSEIAEASGRKVPTLTPEALAALAGYNWPGNVRELGHVLERAVLNTDGPLLSAADLPSSIVSPERVADGATSERPTLDVLERRYVAFVLKETRGNQSRAAEILGISRKALWEKRKRYGME
ncbi:MAG: sigma-54-dependent Fis family transcriptional regulator [Vicinamibacteria bacterium]|nr:sigma-54-dependent Fis family transcriptional regulator [Vicinamibacteria bacterium]